MGFFTNAALLAGFGPAALSAKLIGSKVMGGGGGGGGERSTIPAAPLPLPESPKLEAATTTAEEVVRRKRATISRSIYTSPLGVSGEAQVARKTLLGQ